MRISRWSSSIVRAAVRVIATALIVPAAVAAGAFDAPPVVIREMVYLQANLPGVTEDAYRSFLARISEYYQGQGLNVEFQAGEISSFDPALGQDCGTDVRGQDLIACVGSGKGGFLGPPYFIVGANTDPPFGFSDIGMRAEAHELGHFLGFQDVYWLQTGDGGVQAPTLAELTHEIMKDPYDPAAAFQAHSHAVVAMNIERFSHGGRGALLYPAARAAARLDVGTPAGSQHCEVHARTRDYSLFRSTINAQPSFTTDPDADGRFEMDIFGGDAADHNFDLYYVHCDSGSYWVNSLLTEECSAREGAGSTCAIRCSISGDWCTYEQAHAPEANAGPDQVVECAADRSAPAELDGSHSSDADSTPGTNDDIASFDWYEAGSLRASGERVRLPFSLGTHTVTLQVIDQGGLSDSDDAVVTVHDTQPPNGRITYPPDEACFGPATSPVTVTNNFTDTCDEAMSIAYEPRPEPTYETHGTYSVTVTATDSSGNSANDTVTFTIDLVPPVVSIANKNQMALPTPTSAMSMLFKDDDNDGAAGGVVWERVLLENCVLADGRTYGNDNGLLSDESVVTTAVQFCQLASQCGFTVLTNPTLVVEAYDCGGNRGADYKTFLGTYTLRPGLCGP